MSLLLWPAARLWSLATRTRVRLYASGTWRQQRLERPVVSVGNLSVGGAGKTPFVIWLFSALVEHGLRPAVLTRGYRRPAGEETLLFTRAAHGAAWTPDAVSAGDEVQVMLRHGLAPVGVDGNRLRAGRALEAKGAVDLHLLDDGFQHLALGRDLDIVLVDSTRPPWEDDLLPAGRLRESPSALRRAGVIVLTRVQDWTAREQLEARLRGVAPQAEIYRARTRLTGDVGAAEPSVPGLASASSQPALAFAGVGNPRAFFADLCLAGFRVVGTQPFRDHHRYTARDLRRLEQRARRVGAEALVTTEKDAANLPDSCRNGLELPLRVLGMELEVEQGAKLVDRVAGLVRK